jgi:D-amino peptidase
MQGAFSGPRIPDIASFDGLILLGYHAMAGTPRAILEHTMSSRSWQNFWIKGRKAGELALDAGIASDHGVPTIMTSGDDKLCQEARRFSKDIITVQVKKGLDVEGGELLPKDQAHQLIREGAARAVQNCKKIKPVKIKSPVTLRLELVSRGKLPTRPDVRIIDGRTYEVTGKNVEEALRSLYS